MHSIQQSHVCLPNDVQVAVPLSARLPASNHDISSVSS